MTLLNVTTARAVILPALIGVLLSACAAQDGIYGFDPAIDTATPATTITYNNINPAISMGAAYGDMSRGGHGTFGKFPADFITPFHTHTAAYHGVVVAGTMTNPFEGEANPPAMGPGSYWYVSAGSVHATACVSDTPCQFYFHADSGFDFHPAE